MNTEKVLKTQNCKILKCKNKSISVYGKNPFCRHHVNTLCELKTQNNIFNEIRCNSTIGMVSLDNKMYCNSHYRTLIAYCNHSDCNIYRYDNVLCYDKKWYCKDHKLKTESFVNKMLPIFQNKLNADLVEKICKIHLKNNTYIFQ